MNVVTLPVTLPGQASSNAAQGLDPATAAAQAGDASDPLSSLFAALLSQQIATEPSAKGEPVEAASTKTKPSTDPDMAAILAAMQQVPSMDPSMQIQQVAAAAPASTQPEVPVEAEVRDVLSGGRAGREQPGVRHAYGRMEQVAGESHGEMRRQQVAANAAAFAGSERALPDQANGVAATGDGALKSRMLKPDDVRPEVPVDKMAAMKLQIPASELTQQSSANLQQFAPAPIVTSAQTTPVQNAPATQTSSISPAVGHSAWGEALGDRVVWMVSQQHQGVEMHLNPPSLGPLEVRLTMNDGQASLSFSTQHLPVKEAIESATPRLREMLGDSGISLGSVSVNVGSFSQPQQQPGQQQTPSRTAGSAWSDFMPATDFSSTLPSAVTRVRGDGMVDLFA